MVKVLILFAIPENAAAFDVHFERTHWPLLQALPHLKKVLVNHIAGAAVGESPYYQIVELHFDNQDEMTDALNSKPGQAVARDLASFARSHFRILFAHTEVK